MSERVCVGQIGAPHGVRGLVLVRPFTEAPESVASYGPVTTGSGRELSLAIRSAKKAGLIVAIDGVESREEAEVLRGEKLYIDRERLPAPEVDEFYHVDLIGLRAEDCDGTVLGRVVAIHDFGAGDVIEIDPGRGETVMVPFTAEVVPDVDISGGRLVVAVASDYFEPSDASAQ